VNPSRPHHFFHAIILPCSNSTLLFPPPVVRIMCPFEARGVSHPPLESPRSGFGRSRFSSRFFLLLPPIHLAYNRFFFPPCYRDEWVVFFSVLSQVPAPAPVLELSILLPNFLNFNLLLRRSLHGFTGQLGVVPAPLIVLAPCPPHGFVLWHFSLGSSGLLFWFGFATYLDRLLLLAAFPIFSSCVFPAWESFSLYLGFFAVFGHPRSPFRFHRS